MPSITLIHKPTFTNIHPYPRKGVHDKIAVWGQLHGGNLSLKKSLVVGNAVLGDAFVQQGAQPWHVPNFEGLAHTTPHGGSNFSATLIGVTLQQAIEFFAAHGYEVEEEEQFNDGDEDQPGGPVAVGARPEFLCVTMEQLLTNPAVNPDQDWYQRIVDVFKPANRFQAINEATAAQVRNLLPEGFGTYVVRDRDEKLPSASILYIGMAGTLKIREETLVPGGGGLRSRLGRITPYCYSAGGPWANHFEFGPNATKQDELLALPEAARYNKHRPLETIITDCFILTGIERLISPSYLEAFLLQTYVKSTGALPPANQKF